jgi:hypothetical protein
MFKNQENMNMDFVKDSEFKQWMLGCKIRNKLR